MIPEGKSGDWEVVHQHIPKKDAEAQAWDMYMKHGDQGLRRRPHAGNHVALRRMSDGICFMSTQPFELEENQEFVNMASGNVLVSGLGLGLILKPLSEKCKKVVVLEKEEDVYTLVAPHIDLPNVEIIRADAFYWVPRDGEQFDWAWHDIWATITAKNLPEMFSICSHHKKWVERQVCWSWPLVLEQLEERKDWEEYPKILKIIKELEPLCYAVP